MGRPSLTFLPIIGQRQKIIAGTKLRRQENHDSKLSEQTDTLGLNPRKGIITRKISSPTFTHFKIYCTDTGWVNLGLAALSMKKELGEFTEPSININQLCDSAPSKATTFGHINKITEFRLKQNRKRKHNPTANSFCQNKSAISHTVMNVMFKKKSDKSDCISTAVTLMASKHIIREMTEGCEEWKRKRIQYSEYLEICHVVKGSRCVC